MSQAIKKIDGIHTVDVVFEDKLAHVLATRKTCNAKAYKRIIESLDEAGFQGSIIRVEKGKPKAGS